MVADKTSETMLDERAQQLLKTLIESYIKDGQPVGSRTLSRTAGLELSPATIRNVMADLEEFGFLKSPHTSAGRVPTARGFRIFVDNMLKIKPLKLSVIDQLKVGLDPEMTKQNLVKSASTLLSGITHLVGIVTAPRKRYAKLRQIEFLELSENKILVILVVNQHEVQNRIIHLARKYTQSELQKVANYLNAQFAGCDLREVRHALLSELNSVREDMNRLMQSAIELGKAAFADHGKNENDYVLVGQSNLLEYEDLSDVEKLRQLFNAFNHKREMLHILDKCIVAEGVQIFFGQESGYGPLVDCSLVSAPYSAQGKVLGVLGVIGPTRMAYDRVIPVVDVTAKLLGEALNPNN